MLVVLGAVLEFARTGNIQYVDDDVLGTISIIAGVLTIVPVVIVNAQRSRTRSVQETRHRGPGQ
ncbi:MAG: hypothetical protein ACRYG2_15385 [Janthinobacterium lividum]